MMGGKKLSGMLLALITPLHEDGGIDFDALDRQVDYVMEMGVDGVFVGGTNSESPYFSFRERCEIFRRVKLRCDGGALLCVACIEPTTERTLELMERMSEHRPDFFVAVTPYYFGVTQDVVRMHYERLASKASAPLIVYNIPSSTHNPIQWSTLVKLAQVPNIVGIKDSSGDFPSFSRAMYSVKRTRPDFAWFMGDDSLIAPALLAGASGMVTGLGNVTPMPYIDMMRASERGDTKGVNEGQERVFELLKIIDCTGKGVPSIKAACSLLGRGSPRAKLEAMTLRVEEIEKVARVLEGLNLFL